MAAAPPVIIGQVIIKRLGYFLTGYEKGVKELQQDDREREQDGIARRLDELMKDMEEMTRSFDNSLEEMEKLEEKRRK